MLHADLKFYHLTNQTKITFFTKWPPADILDGRKSLSIAFLTISDQYATFIYFGFFSQNGRRRPFLITENHFRSHFSPFQIKSQLFFYQYSLNYCRRPFWMTEHHLRLHFSPFQINEQLLFYFFKFLAQNDRRRPFWMAENHFRSHFSPLQINTQPLCYCIFLHKMDAGGHFELPKIIFDRISRHFRSIHNFFKLFSKTAAILDAQFLPKLIGTSLYSRSVATSIMKLIAD